MNTPPALIIANIALILYYASKKPKGTKELIVLSLIALSTIAYDAPQFFIALPAAVKFIKEKDPYPQALLYSMMFDGIHANKYAVLAGTTLIVLVYYHRKNLLKAITPIALSTVNPYAPAVFIITHYLTRKYKPPAKHVLDSAIIASIPMIVLHRTMLTVPMSILLASGGNVTKERKNKTHTIEIYI